MDDNKLDNKCRKCIYKKESFFSKIINEIDLGPFLMCFSTLVGGFTIIIHLMPMIGITGTILLVCAFLFLIGFFKVIFFF